MLHHRRRCAITPHTHLPVGHSAELPGHGPTAGEAFIPEDVILQTARALAREVGLIPVSPGAGAVLRLLAAAGGAKSVVEIGTGTGVSGVWLLRGMRSDGVLTTIDVDGEHQRIARRIFVEAGFAPSRTRVITGQALDVLPRLADGAYDLIFVDGDLTEYADCVQAALRLLRPGGMLVLDIGRAESRADGRADPGGRIADPVARDPETVALREVVKAVREAPEWIAALVPAGEGLLCAVKTN